MRGVVAMLGLLAGCADIFDLATVARPDAGVEPDASAPEDAAFCEFGRFGRYGAGGSGLVDICVTSQPDAQLVLPPTIDTNDASSCSIMVDFAGHPPFCVVWAGDISIGAATRVTGLFPLVLVATNNIAISGALDLSSVRGVGAGAGDGHINCSGTLAGQDGSLSIAGAGGAGGSFQTLGGRGGNGDGNQTVGGTPMLEPPPLARVAGGCRGGGGGGGGSPLTGGAGGGAVYVIAGNMIVLADTGLINASGAGGGGGKSGVSGTEAGSGGGGGGSGGLIGLDAPRIAFGPNSRLIANGGGGGGGGSRAGGANGGNGGSAQLDTYPFAASGGIGVSEGGAGGDALTPAGDGMAGADTRAGAGGGGGTGFIKVYTTQLQDSGVLASPAYN